MSRHVWTAIGIGVVAVAFLVGRATAQPATPEWMNRTPEHETFKKMEGTWDLQLSFWMMPGAPPSKGTATATYERILGGNYLEERVKSDWQGEAFEGRGLQGYDTYRKEWVAIWMDSMSPVPSVMRGKEKDGVVTMFGEEPDMMTGKLAKVKHTLEWQSDDRFTARGFKIAPDGTEVKTMEIVYTRRAADGCGCGCE